MPRHTDARKMVRSAPFPLLLVIAMALGFSLTSFAISPAAALSCAVTVPEPYTVGSATQSYGSASCSNATYRELDVRLKEPQAFQPDRVWDFAEDDGTQTYYIAYVGACNNGSHGWYTEVKFNGATYEGSHVNLNNSC